MPWVAREIERIGFQTGQRDDLRILMDNGYTEDVGGQKVVHEAVSLAVRVVPAGLQEPALLQQDDRAGHQPARLPVILVMGPNLDPIKDQLGDYVGQKYAQLVVPRGLQDAGANRQSSDTSSLYPVAGHWSGLTDPVSRAKFLKFLLYREPMNTLGAREFYLFVRKDVPTLGPGAHAARHPPRWPSPVRGSARRRAETSAAA